MRKSAGKIIRFVIRWTIAIVGVAWVLSNLHWHDRVLISMFRIGGGPGTDYATLLERPAKPNSDYIVIDPDTGQRRAVDAGNVWSTPDQKYVTLRNPPEGAPAQVRLDGIMIRGEATGSPIVSEFIVHYDRIENGVRTHVVDRLEPDEVVGYTLQMPQPKVQEGVRIMVATADPWLLAASLAVMPLTYMFTTVRWHQLLKALGISITLWRTFVLNMVGSFYNTFMLGSTGGDVLKAYYAAKQAPTRRTAAVMSVIVDRAIGLLALIIVGGTMAAIQYTLSADRSDAVSKLCLQVAIGAVVLLSAALAFSIFVYWRGLRQAIRLDAIVARIPMQTQVQKIVDVVRIYRERPLLIFAAILMTFPVHIAVIISAMLAGMAFDLPIALPYYFIVVPVVVLVGAVPLSPQGAGVMEAFAFYLTQSQGATVNQALALTMSIRLAAMLWNLVGGVFVLKGGYHTPSEQEQAALETESSPAAQTPV